MWGVLIEKGISSNNLVSSEPCTIIRVLKEKLSGITKANQTGLPPPTTHLSKSFALCTSNFSGILKNNLNTPDRRANESPPKTQPG